MGWCCFEEEAQMKLPFLSLVSEKKLEGSNQMKMDSSFSFLYSLPCKIICHLHIIQRYGWNKCLMILSLCEGFFICCSTTLFFLVLKCG